MWMKLYSDAFLNDSYLKYVGWTMHDKVSFGICIWYKLGPINPLLPDLSQHAILDYIKSILFVKDLFLSR